MLSLDKTFEDLLARLRASDALNPANADPIYYFVYPAPQMLAMKQALPLFMAKLRNQGLGAVRISLSDLIWELIDRSGRWDEWLELESGAEPAQLNEAVKDVLRAEGGLVDTLTERLSKVTGAQVAMLTECEALHPYFRVRTIESWLHGKLAVPVVVFYPGRRIGQYGLHFLGFYPEDGNYRSTLIGGV